MSKKNRNEMTDEVTNEQADLAGTIGREDEILEASLREVDPFEEIPTFTPGKPGFEAGMHYAGKFVRTKRVYSDKFTAGKIDAETKKTYRDLHILEDKNGKKFGLWSVGQLGYMFEKTEAGQYIKVVYEGKAEEALKAGQSPAHNFKFFTIEPTQAPKENIY